MQYNIEIFLPYYLNKNWLLDVFINLQNFSWADLIFHSPEIYLAAIIIMGLVLVSAANFYPKASLVEQKTFITPTIYVFTKNSLYVALILFLIKILYFWSESYIIYNAYSITDPYTDIIKAIIILTMSILLSASATYIKKHPRHLMEYSVLIVLMLLFLQILVSSYSLITMFLAIIGFSLNIYVLLLFDSFNHASREAGIKYFYLSTFSSGLIIGGIFFAYFLFQNTNFLSIAWQLHQEVTKNTFVAKPFLLNVMLYLMIFGFLFKLASFPCHLWAPEIYDGSPHPITAIFVLPVKIGVFILFLRVVYYTFGELYYIWNYIIWMSSLLSMIWGCLGALNEARIKRFIAYSSINQMGFLLMGVACGALESLRASLIYLLLYIVMNLGFFLLFLTTREQKTKRALTYLTDFNDYAQMNYFHSVTLVVILFSMAGIPPLGGFFGKYYLFVHTFETGQLALLFIGMFTSVIAAYYYLRIIKVMWFEEPITNRFYFQTALSWQELLLSVYLWIEGALIWFVIFSPGVFPLLDLISLNCINPLTSIYDISETFDVNIWTPETLLSFA